MACVQYALCSIADYMSHIVLSGTYIGSQVQHPTEIVSTEEIVDVHNCNFVVRFRGAFFGYVDKVSKVSIYSRTVCVVGCQYRSGCCTCNVK